VPLTAVRVSLGLFKVGWLLMLMCRVLRAYQQMYASMHADGLDPSIPPTIKTQSRRTSKMRESRWCSLDKRCWFKVKYAALPGFTL